MIGIKLTKTTKKIKIQTIKRNITRAERLKNEKERKIPDSSPVLLIIYLIGILGIMNAANTVMNIADVYFFTAETAAVVLSTVMWYIYIYHNRYFNYIVLPMTLIAVVPVFINPGSASQSLLSTDSISEISPLLLGVLAYMSVLLIFTLEFVSRNHSIMFIICSALLILGPMVGITFTPLTSVMIIIFQFGFIVLNMNSVSPRKTLITDKSRKTGFISTVIAAGLLIVCFLPALILENIYEPDILSHVYYVDGFIQDIVSYFSQKDEDGILDGTINRGNLRQNGEQMFEADVVKMPEDRLYLKAFTGSSYNGENWENAFGYFSQEANIYADSYTLYSPSYNPDSYGDDDFYYFRSNRNSRRRYYYREPFINNILNNTIQSFFDDLNELLREHGIYEEIQYVTGTENNKTAITAHGTDDLQATIRYNEGSVEYRISDDSNIQKFYVDADELPNYPSLLLTETSDPVNTIYSDGVTTNFSEEDDINRVCISPYENKFINILIPYYSEKSTNDIRQSNESVSFTYSTAFGNTDSAAKLYADRKWSGSRTYENFIDNYISAIQNNYTAVPYENMPRLTELCSSTELTELNDITTFILYTLQTNASYSTTPGSVPYNKDTIEYFLFENHKGYCVHFATTAALMYRMYGIPARYVTGYVIDKEAFEAIGNTGGTSDDYKFKAQVTDYAAHAWVELFLKDYGWVPVEVTPTKEGEMIAEYPGYDRSDMYRIMEKYDWHFSKDEIANSGNNAVNDDDGLTLGQIFTIVTLCIICAAIIFILSRRIFILHRQKTMNCRQLFDRLIKALHFCGLLTDMNGSEENFAEMFSSTVPIIDKADSEHLINILESDNFSEDNISSRDADYVREIYIKSSRYLYDHMKWYKKPVFKFIKYLI